MKLSKHGEIGLTVHGIIAEGYFELFDIHFYQKALIARIEHNPLMGATS